MENHKWKYYMISYAGKGGTFGRMLFGRRGPTDSDAILYWEEEIAKVIGVKVSLIAISKIDGPISSTEKAQEDTWSIIARQAAEISRLKNELDNIHDRKLKR